MSVQTALIGVIKLKIWDFIFKKCCLKNPMYKKNVLECHFFYEVQLIFYQNFFLLFSFVAYCVFIFTLFDTKCTDWICYNGEALKVRLNGSKALEQSFKGILCSHNCQICRKYNLYCILKFLIYFSKKELETFVYTMIKLFFFYVSWLGFHWER